MRNGTEKVGAEAAIEAAVDATVGLNDAAAAADDDDDDDDDDDEEEEEEKEEDAEAEPCVVVSDSFWRLNAPPCTIMVEWAAVATVEGVAVLCVKHARRNNQTYIRSDHQTSRF